MTTLSATTRPNVAPHASREALTLRVAAIAALAALAPRLALAQEPAPPVKPVEPLLNRKALRIPGAVPEVKFVPQSGRPIPLGDALGQAPPPPPPSPPPPSAGAGGGAANPSGEGPEFRSLAARNCRPLSARDKIPFEFKDAEIKDIVMAISKTTCRNFILTQKVRSQKFDIISPVPLTPDEMWQAFLSALEANDFAVYQVGKFYKIVQGTDATRAPVPIVDEKRRVTPDDRVLTKIFRLAHATDINAVVNYLNIFKSAKGQIHPFQATNTIVATDYASSIDRIERILDEVDVPAGAQERVHIVPVEFATATEIAEKLTAIFEPAKANPGAPKTGRSAQTERTVKGKRSGEDLTYMAETFSVSKIIADDRTNRLIIIASDEAMKQVHSIMKKIDVPSEGSGDGQVHVLRLRHANAEELSTTLSSLAQGKPTSGKSSRASKGNANAAPGAAPAAGGSQAQLFQGDVKITADKATNSLVITASKGDFASLRRVIDQLDVQRFQVFVEVAIMEVSVNRDRRLGVSMHGGLNPKIDGKDSPIIFGSAPAQGFNSLTLTQNPVGLVQLLGLAGALRGPPIPGTENIISGGIPAVGVILQALQTTNDVNVISTPHLLTMDNEEAEIQVNEKRPFNTGLSLGGLGGALGGLGGLGGALGGALGGQAGAAGAGALGALGGLAGGLGLGGAVNIVREDVGLTLKLKPQINDEQWVRMEIDQELSDVAGQDQATGVTITAKRAAKTVVVVRDQDSVVIGGLVRDRDSVDESKIPFLGDLPILGALFRRQQKKQEKTNLILIMTPYIIRGPSDFYKVYKRKMDERKEFVERYSEDPRELREHIDWDRKIGPLAYYLQELREEKLRAENGGPGTDGDTVVTPDTLPEGDGEKGEDGVIPPSSGSAPPQAAPPMPDIPAPQPQINP